MFELTQSKIDGGRKYRAHLIRLIQAAGQTLINRAESLVATKPGTSDFKIVIHFAQGPNLSDTVPTIEVRHTFVSDEGAAVADEWPEAYRDIPAPDNLAEVTTDD